MIESNSKRYTTLLTGAVLDTLLENISTGQPSIRLFAFQALVAFMTKLHAYLTDHYIPSLLPNLVRNRFEKEGGNIFRMIRTDEWNKINSLNLYAKDIFDSWTMDLLKQQSILVQTIIWTWTLFIMVSGCFFYGFSR